jgi:hypothetical protein
MAARGGPGHGGLAGPYIPVCHHSCPSIDACHGGLAGSMHVVDAGVCWSSKAVITAVVASCHDAAARLTT